MRKTIIDKLCEAINAERGITYPQIGHLQYSNIAGDGRNYRTVYVIVNEGGGVSRSSHNAASPRQTATRLRATLTDLIGSNHI